MNYYIFSTLTRFASRPIHSEQTVNVNTHKHRTPSTVYSPSQKKWKKNKHDGNDNFSFHGVKYTNGSYSRLIHGESSILTGTCTSYACGQHQRV